MLSPDMHTIIERVPTIAEYRRLCEAVGWGNVMNFTAAERALPTSLYAVVAEVLAFVYRLNGNVSRP